MENFVAAYTTQSRKFDVGNVLLATAARSWWNSFLRCFRYTRAHLHLIWNEVNKTHSGMCTSSSALIERRTGRQALAASDIYQTNSPDACGDGFLGVAKCNELWRFEVACVGALRWWEDDRWVLSSGSFRSYWLLPTIFKADCSLVYLRSKSQARQMFLL